MTITETPTGLGHEHLHGVVDRILGGVDTDRRLPGTGRRYELVHVDDDCEAWLIAWPTGTGLAMHDHHGSEALIHVVAGTLCERFPDGEASAVRPLEAGRRYELAADHVHEVLNVEELEAVSLHVYSPRLTDLGFRESGDVGCELIERA